MNVANIARVTATGDVTTSDSYLRSVVLTSGAAAAAVLTVRVGGSGGTVVLTLRTGSATLAESVPVDFGSGIWLVSPGSTSAVAAGGVVWSGGVRSVWVADRAGRAVGSGS